MYTIKNPLRNHLDLGLAEKLIDVFIQNMNKKKLPFQITKKEKLPSMSFLKEKIQLTVSDSKEPCIITFVVVLQHLYIENPVGGGMPRFFYQGVTDINFSSKDQEVIGRIENQFECFINRKDNTLPESIVRDIYFK